MQKPPCFHGFISEQNELFWPHHVQRILKKYAPLLQTYCSVYQICPRTYSIILARCLRSIFLALSMFMKLLFKWLAAFIVLWYVRYVRYDFKISRKHQRLVFVFSLLVKLIWFSETAKLSMLGLSNFKRINSYQLYLHCCMEANHMFRNAFSFKPCWDLM